MRSTGLRTGNLSGVVYIIHQQKHAYTQRHHNHVTIHKMRRVCVREREREGVRERERGREKKHRDMEIERESWRGREIVCLLGYFGKVSQKRYVKRINFMCAPGKTLRPRFQN